MGTRLERKDHKTLWICLGIAVISLVIITSLFYQAFPEASIRFSVGKSQSADLASKFLQTRNMDLDGYRHSVIFNYDNRAKTFLEKELGAGDANQLMGSRVRLWYWSNRWFKPLEKKEITINISPTGELTGFNHIIPEEGPGDSLASANAQTLAMDFLANTIHISPDSIEFVETSSEKRPNRLDHTFIWKKQGFLVHDAEYRYKVVVQGSEIGSYREYLHVPETWQRGYEKLRSRNDTTGLVASFLLFLTLGAMLWMMVKHTRNINIRWKTALWFGITAAVLTLLSRLNEMPLDQFYYTTTDSWSGFLFRHILLDLLLGLLAGIAIFFLTTSAEPLFRERYTQHLSLSNLLTWQGVRSKSFFISSIVGFTMTFAFIAYQVVFYLTADRLGGWAPQDIPYSNMLNTAFPWVYVLLSGFIPAVSEEFISRMFSIPFFQKIVKLRWLAVVIPAFIWGFAHANYAQEPFYIRGLEVGMAGIIIGLVMVRFGILAPLVWHYCIDAVYTALVLIRSGNPYYIVTAIIGSGLLLVPFLIALVAYVKTGKFSDHHKLTNASEGTNIIHHDPEETTVPNLLYKPLERKQTIPAVVITLLLLSVFLVKTDLFGPFVRYPSSPKQAKQAANDFLQSRGVAVDSFKTVTWSTSRFDPMIAKYVLENSDINRLNRLYGSHVKAQRWAIRYFQPLQKLEYRVHVDPVDLSVIAFIREMQEDAPGVTIPNDSARTLACDFALTQGFDVNNLTLVEGTEEKLKNRTDHHFVWESTDNDSLTLADMHIRVSVDVQGNEIAGFNRYPKIPETWQRQREKRTLINTLHLGLRIVMIILLMLISIRKFISLAKVGSIQWKPSLLIAGGVALFFIMDGLSRMRLMLSQYPTSIEPGLFNISTLVSIVLTALIIFAGSSMLLSMVSALFPGSLSLYHLNNRKILVRDALFTAIITLAGLLAIGRVLEFIATRFPQYVLIQELPMPSFIDAPLPLFSNLVYVLYIGLFTTLAVGMASFVLGDVLRKPARMGIFIFLLIIALVSLQTRTPGEVLLQALNLILPLGWLAFIAIRLAKNNYFAYLYTVILVIGSDAAYTLFIQGNTQFSIQAIIMALIIAAFLLFGMLYRQDRHKMV